MNQILLSLATVLVLVFCFDSGRIIWRKIRLRRWSKQLRLPQHFSVFETLYQSVDGFLLSKQERQQGQDAPALVYGEIEFTPFVALLSLCDLNENSVFFDLGSGSGKAVISCAMVFNPKKAIGIEKLAALYHASEQQKNKLCRLKQYETCNRRIEFRHQDFMSASLQGATHIFINASAFFGELWSDLEKKLNELAKLQWIISTSKPLILDNFRCCHQTKVAMSWGIVTAYIHQRVA